MALLSAEAFEIGDDVVPGLEGVAAEVEVGGHRVALLLPREQIVAIEQVAAVGVDGVVPGRHVDVFGHPGAHRGHVVTDEIHLIVLDEHTYGLHHRRGGVVVGIVERLHTNINNRPFAVLLAVVDPSDHGHDSMHKRVVVHAVLAVEADGLAVVLCEGVVGMHQRVLVAEESEHPLLLVVGDALEVAFRRQPVLFHQRLVDIELLNAVLSGREELLLARQSVALHRVGNAECRIDADAVEAVEHLGVHTSHRCADDEAGLLVVAEPLQQAEGLAGMDGQVGGYHPGIGQHGAQPLNGARLSAAAEAVHINHGFPLHQFGELLDVLILLFHN